MRSITILLQIILVIISSTYINLSAQTISVCPPQQLDLETSLQSQLASCGNNSYITINASDIPQVPTGPYTGPATITADGTLAVEIFNSANNSCGVFNLNIDLIETQFTYTISGCHVLDITGPDNPSGCTYSYVVNGTTYNTQNPTGIQLPNGGQYNVEVTANCGGCIQNQTYTINVIDQEAALNFSSTEASYYDPDFNAWVVCTTLQDAIVDITDFSQFVGPGATYSLEIISPSGAISNSSASPNPYSLTMDEEGLYTINFTITSGGCVSTISYQLFVSNPNVAVELSAPLTVEAFYCENETIELSVCSGSSCSNNPPGTVYTVAFTCSNYVYQTTSIPFTLNVPLSSSSCSSSCSTGQCACDLIITANRPCVDALSSTYCPIKVSPQPDANFAISPANPQNTYCVNQNLTFEADWEGIDCNGPNPLPSLCENQDPQFEILPPTGWTLQSGAFDSNTFQVSFDTPGSYSICYTAVNSCGIESNICESICILDDTAPSVDWLNTNIVCVGDAINPEIDFTTVACANTNIDWSSDDAEVTITNSDQEIPSVVFTAPGDFDLDVSVSGLCNPFSDTAPFTVCDAPGINLVQPVVNLCLLEPYCFGDLISVVWNNCPGDIVWTIPGATGSPFTNPAPSDLCISWDNPQTVIIDIAASNNCGTTTESITVNIETSPACPIDEPGEFCIGDQIDISVPIGGTAPTWYSSTDGINFNPLVGGMPQTPSETTWYYVESSVNGCFCISDTVQAILIPEPVFTFEVSNENPCPGELVTFSLNPPQGNVNWYDAGGTLLATQPEYEFTPTAATTITGELIYGLGAVQCDISGSLTTTPVPNPIVLDCSSIPSTWCDGDLAQPLPAAAPAGGNFYITDGANVVDAAPTEIDPSVLGIGSYYVVYEFTTATPSICTLLDSCQFTITTPQIPVFAPTIDSVCFNGLAPIQEMSGLSGQWSSNCPGIIDNSGFFSPEALGCTEGSTIEVYYTGDCLVNDTLEFYVIPIENFTITTSNSNPCNGEQVSFTTNPTQANVDWEDQDGNLLGTGANLDLIVTTPIVVTAISNFGTQSSACSSSQSVSINPVPNPIALDCSSIPTLWCDGDPAQPLPAALPAGGNFYITDGTSVVDAAPANIDPTALGTGAYYVVYEFTTSAPSVCTFLDSCQFTITTPQTPIITPVIDTLCYYSEVSFQETSGLAGAWSSNCPGAIDASGNFTPQSAGCPEGTVVEVYYTGDCIENETIEIYLIPTPTFSIVPSTTSPCPGDIVTFSLNPPQANINWLDENGATLGTDQSIDITVNESFEISAEVIYGTQNVSCAVSETYTILTEPNPIVLDCSALPTIWCEGDPAAPLPLAIPAGGDFSITDGNVVLINNPSNIDPSILDAGSYYLVYEVQGIGISGCTFRDSCAFEILAPAIPNIQPNPESVCYNTPVQFQEMSGLSGAWSSDCPGAITNSGLFSPATGACTPGSTVEVYYTGDCILNDTLTIYIIPVPAISLNISETEICANTCVALDADIVGDIETAIWTLSWGTQTAAFSVGEEFCPDDLGINSDIEVQAELVVTTPSDPVCLVNVGVVFNVIGIPVEDFILESPQCIADNILLPDCDNCDSYEIVFTNIDGTQYPCQIPGGACNLPETGAYQYEAIYNFGVCSSDPFVGEFLQIDEPFLEILSLDYDSCAPVANYITNHGGHNYDLIWETYGTLGSTSQTSADTFLTTINHSVDIEVDTVYTDIVTISNMCGTTTDSRTVYHMALPDFTIDPDSMLFCDNTFVPLELGFAQPLHVDSILINYFYQGDQNIILEEPPEEPLTFMFDSGNDTLVINFTVTAFNPCGTITKMVTAFVLPTDVSADIDIAAITPACFGDTIPISINSSGNINFDLRTVVSNNPLISTVEILGDWYIIPQEGSQDGNYTIQLTEYGFCGVDAAIATFEYGPTLTGGFYANNACKGGPVTFTPSISQDASLTWYFEPDEISFDDFPSPFYYPNPGIYYPVLIAENPDYCPLTFTAPVEIYNPIAPQITCDASCDGSPGCNVDFSDEHICISLYNADSFISYQWKVNGQFYPEYGEEIRIPMELIKPCENNFVGLTALDIHGCSTHMNKRIDFNDALIHIPNSFTPNEDGVNDVFRPVILGEPSEYLFQIFDRWGKKVFETADPNDSWRGNEEGSDYYTQADAYSYIVRWKPCNRAESKMKEITGHVIVVR